MRDVPVVSDLDWTATPLELLAAWPADRALMMLHSGRVHPRWARWSIIAAPHVRFQFNGRSRWIGEPPQSLRNIRFSNDPLIDLNAVVRATALVSEVSARPFAGGWIGYFSYDLGRWIEPHAQIERGAVDDRHWPLIDLAWCPNALLFDWMTLRWYSIQRLKGVDVSDFRFDRDLSDFSIGDFRPQMTREGYVAAVRRTIDYIAAGDIFQANIAQRFSADIAGSPRALAHAAFLAAQPWYGGYMEFGHTQRVISLSPELFLHVDPSTRRVVTRPIKGTRPTRVDPHTLASSSKDAAELHMIVDLMRNDLGRVCEFGSIHVPSARKIETHPTVHHGVGEVAGTLREIVTVADLLRAAFPGGSVTGAPKIRAMQIIDELEPVRRGPYCGAIGYISDCGAVNLNIAIRTLLMRGQSSNSRFDDFAGEIDYSAGAGIVADSQPYAEYDETRHKTEVLRSLMRTPAFVAPT
jgi:para-aminobenzoate synthetase component I